MSSIHDDFANYFAECSLQRSVVVVLVINGRGEGREEDFVMGFLAFQVAGSETVSYFVES